jgi:hypothetical protein
MQNTPMKKRIFGDAKFTTGYTVKVEEQKQEEPPLLRRI